MLILEKAKEQALVAVERAFRDALRPREFIRGTCYCQECLEHNRTMAAHTPATISLTELGNPGWDPMCFANEAAFAYFLPAMVRLAFEEPAYIDQLLFHLNCPDRPGPLTPPQAEALLQALRALSEAEEESVVTNLDVSYLKQAMKKLENLLSGHPERVT